MDSPPTSKHLRQTSSRRVRDLTAFFEAAASPKPPKPRLPGDIEKQQGSPFRLTLVPASQRVDISPETPLTPSMLSAAHPELRRRTFLPDSDEDAPPRPVVGLTRPRKSILKRESVSEKSSNLRFKEEGFSDESRSKRRVSISESESFVREVQVSPNDDEDESVDIPPPPEDCRTSLDPFTNRFLARQPEFRSLDQQQRGCAGCNRELTSMPTFAERFAGTVKYLLLSKDIQSNVLLRPDSIARRCHFSGLLFCPSCHVEEKAILPSLVLAAWDFTPKPVCRLAASCLSRTYRSPVISAKQIHPAVKRMVTILPRIHAARKELILLKQLFSQKQRTLWWAEEDDSCHAFTQDLHHRLLPFLPGMHWMRSVDLYSLEDLVALNQYQKNNRLSMLARGLRATPKVLGPLLGCSVEPPTARRVQTPPMLPPRPPLRRRSFTLSYSRNLGWVEGEEVDDDSSHHHIPPILDEEAQVPSYDHITLLEDFVIHWESHVLQCSDCCRAFEELRPGFRNLLTCYQKTLLL